MSHLSFQQTFKMLQKFTHIMIGLKVVEMIVHPQKDHFCYLWAGENSLSREQENSFKRFTKSILKTFHYFKEQMTSNLSTSLQKIYSSKDGRNIPRTHIYTKHQNYKTTFWPWISQNCFFLLNEWGNNKKKSSKSLQNEYKTCQEKM